MPSSGAPGAKGSSWAMLAFCCVTLTQPRWWLLVAAESLSWFSAEEAVARLLHSLWAS